MYVHVEMSVTLSQNLSHEFRLVFCFSTLAKPYLQFELFDMNSVEQFDKYIFNFKLMYVSFEQ